MLFRRYTLGRFSHVAGSARIGAGSVIGSYARVGQNARLGKMCNIGDYARIGEGAILGEGVRTGTHTRIGPGAVVPEFASLGDADLVLDDRIIPGLCSGSVTLYPASSRDRIQVSMISGRFSLPYMEEEQVSELIDAHCWGDEQALEPYRVAGHRPLPVFFPLPIAEEPDPCGPGL